MLHLTFAAKNEFLIKKINEQLQKAWDADPLNTPNVIFADKQIEQWFRLNWVKQYGVLANLKNEQLETFLWQSTAPQKNTYLLSGIVLQNLIQAALVDMVEYNGQTVPYYKTLKGLSKYLEKNEATKLSSISALLAKLFLEYEYCRPSNFISNKKGILDAWKQNDSQPYFSKGDTEDPIEEWQRTLYSKIFHSPANGEDSFFTKAFNNAPEGTPQYLTLSYAYGQMTHEKKKALWTKPVYIFGLAGCSQFHRQILQDMAQYVDVYVYIQNPCAEFWEDVNVNEHIRSFNKKNAHKFNLELKENEDGEEANVHPNENKLLSLWGKAGRDNIKLWCEAADYDFDYLDPDKASDNTVLHALQNTVLSRQSESSVKLKNDNSILLFKAPSVTREVENLKEQIFKDMENDPTLRLDEMIVLVPKLDNYRVAIQRVFDSVDEYSGEYLPYTIVDAQEDSSLTAGAVANLMQIARNGELSRTLLFELLQNAVVKDSLKINDETIEEWKNWVAELNIYREKVNLEEKSEIQKNPHSFSHGIKRLILHRLMHSRFEHDGTAFHPYGNIESSNDASLEKFCSIIETLENLIIHKNDNNNIAVLREIIQFFITPENFAEEGKIVKNILKELQYAKWQLYAGREYIPFNELEGIITRGVSGIREGSGKFLVSGLNFTEIKPTRAFSMKVVYILGMNEKDFPGKPKQSTLDLRIPTPQRQPRWPGDSDDCARNRYAFLCSLMDVKNAVRISYLGIDLKKDEALFPANIVEDLRSFMNTAILSEPWKEYEIKLDEERNVKEIFSSNRLKKRELNKIKPQDGRNEKSLMDGLQPLEIPDEISVRTILNFASNPFEFQISQTLKLEESDSLASAEFEPISINGLQQSIIGKDLFKDKSESDKKAKSFDEIYDESQFVKFTNETGVLPESPFATNTRQELTNALSNQINSATDMFSSFKQGSEISASINIVDSNNNDKTVIIRGIPAWEGIEKSSNKVAFFDLCNNTFYTKNKIMLYMLALLKTLELGEATSIVIAGISGSQEPWMKTLDITVEEAKEKLGTLIKKAFIDRYPINWPCGILEENVVSTLDLYKEKLNDIKNGCWKNRIPEATLFTDEDYGLPKTDEELLAEFNEWKNIFKATLG